MTYARYVLVALFATVMACGANNKNEDNSGAIWTSDSTRIEIWSRGRFYDYSGVNYYWTADAAELTATELGLLQSLSEQPGKQPQGCSDPPWFDLYVTDRSGNRRNYQAIGPYCAATLVSYDTVSSLARCQVEFDLGSTQDTAPTVQAGRCFPVVQLGQTDSWARLTVPTGETRVALARGKAGVSSDAALVLYDATGVTVIDNAGPGSSLTITPPGDYAVDLRNPTTSDWPQVALEVRRP
jgi:hypothetical protein